MAKESVAMIDSITAEIRSRKRRVKPYAVRTVSPGECVTVGPSFNANGVYSAPDTAVTQCCLIIRPGGTTCAVNPTSLTSGRGMWSASFTNAPKGDYYLNVKGNGGGQYVTDLTVAQVGGGQCHRTVSIMPSAYAADTAVADDEEDDTCDDVQSLFVNSLTYYLDRTDSPEETLVQLGISPPTLPLVTFNFSIPDDRKLKSCTLGEVRSHAIEATKQGMFSAAFMNVPIGSSVLRVHLDDGSTSSFPVEVLPFAKIERQECEAEEQVVEA